MKNNKNITEFISGNSDWKFKAKWRKENSFWLKNSQKIALKILSELKRTETSQKELAEKLNVSQQQVSKILKGQENLTLETIGKIELVLGIKLVNIDSFNIELKDVQLQNPSIVEVKRNVEIETKTKVELKQTVENRLDLFENIDISTEQIGEENSYSMAA